MFHKIFSSLVRMNCRYLTQEYEVTAMYSAISLCVELKFKASLSTGVAHMIGYKPITLLLLTKVNNN